METINGKAISKLLIVIGVALIIAAVLEASYYALSLHQNLSNPSSSPATSSTPSQATMVTPTNNAPSKPLVTIIYHSQMETNGSGLFMDLSIRNDGYAVFNTDPARISVVFNGNQYPYSKYWTQVFGDWETVDISSGSVYSGTLFFLVPNNVSPQAYTPYYNSTDYNIVYQTK